MTDLPPLGDAPPASSVKRTWEVCRQGGALLPTRSLEVSGGAVFAASQLPVLDSSQRRPGPGPPGADQQPASMHRHISDAPPPLQPGQATMAQQFNATNPMAEPLFAPPAPTPVPYLSVQVPAQAPPSAPHVTTPADHTPTCPQSVHMLPPATYAMHGLQAFASAPAGVGTAGPFGVPPQYYSQYSPPVCNCIGTMRRQGGGVG